MNTIKNRFKNFNFWTSFPDWFYKLLGFISVMACLYIIGSFIALDLNPKHWLLFTTGIGRFIFIVATFYISIKITTDHD